MWALSSSFVWFALELALLGCGNWLQILFCEADESDDRLIPWIPTTIVSSMLILLKGSAEEPLLW